MHNNIKMLKKITLYATALIGVLVLFNSCKKDYETIENIDDAQINAYIKKNNLNMSKDPSGYYYSILDPGTGNVLKNSDSIYYSYTFRSLDGRVLNQTTDLSIPGTFLGYTDRFSIGNTSYVFTPVREVLARLKRGGKANLIIPSYMAFGRNGLSDIEVGPNESLVLNLGIYPLSKKHEIDDFSIQSFITKNKLTLTKDPSRAYYNIITPGTGTDAITTSSTITANYTVRYLDGSVLQASTDGTFSSVLDGLYEGWQLILPNKVRAGGKLRLVIPSDLAGGGAQPLDFDIEIISVKN
jgi:FKBP-type peptidyl-prolyl cis-trans isomerase